MMMLKLFALLGAVVAMEDFAVEKEARDWAEGLGLALGIGAIAAGVGAAVNGDWGNNRQWDRNTWGGNNRRQNRRQKRWERRQERRENRWNRRNNQNNWWNGRRRADEVQERLYNAEDVWSQ